MSNKKHETVACNVSAKHQFREVTKMIPHEEVDVSKMETTTPTREKSSQVGNVAAMREALEFAEYELCAHGLFDASKLVKSALSAPPRNCDVGTAEEQVERHKRLFESMSHITKDCWVVGCRKCIAAWAQMPYEEGGAK